MCGYNSISGAAARVTRSENGKRRLTLVSSAGCCGPDLQIEDRVLRRVAAWMGVLDNLCIVGYMLLMVQTESAVMLQDGWESQV